MSVKRAINGALFKTKRGLVKASPTLFAVAATVGVAVTVVLAVKATPKALERIKEEEAQTPVEKVKAAGACYIPAAGAGVATILCIFGSNIMNKKQQANLLAAYTAVDRAYRRYKAKTVEMLGADGEAEIHADIAKDEAKKCPTVIVERPADSVLFYDEIGERYFTTTFEDIIEAEQKLNLKFVARGYVKLNEFYQFLDIPETELGEMIGWGLLVGRENYGYSSISFIHEDVDIEDGFGETVTCYILRFPDEPTYDFCM